LRATSMCHAKTDKYTDVICGLPALVMLRLDNIQI
jgi:hypothetical protein